MKLLWLSFRSELIKVKRTLALSSTIILPSAISIVMLLIAYIKSEDFAKMGMNPWIIYTQMIFGIFGSLLLPMYATVMAYSVNHVETEANAWKSIFALPLPRTTIYLAKLIFAVLMILLCLSFHSVLIFISGLLLSILKPEIGFQDYNSEILIIAHFIKFFLCSISIFSIQFLISAYWNDFIKPVGFGILATIVGIIVAPGKYLFLNPYSLPVRIANQFQKEDLTIFIPEVISSLVWSLLVLCCAYFVIQRKVT